MKLDFKPLLPDIQGYFKENHIEDLIRFWKIDTYPSGLDLAAVRIERQRDLEQKPNDVG